MLIGLNALGGIDLLKNEDGKRSIYTFTDFNAALRRVLTHKLLEISSRTLLVTGADTVHAVVADNDIAIR